MTFEEAIASVPEQVTAWSVRSRRRKTRFYCELSWLNDETEDLVTGHGSTPTEAVIAACKAYQDSLRLGEPTATWYDFGAVASPSQKD
jgi:hypothetical protein